MVKYKYSLMWMTGTNYPYASFILEFPGVKDVSTLVKPNLLWLVCWVERTFWCNLLRSQKVEQIKHKSRFITPDSQCMVYLPTFVPSLWPMVPKSAIDTKHDGF